MGELRLGRVPHLDRVGIVTDKLLEVRRQRAPVRLETAAAGADALGDVEDDAGETVLVDVDLLVVGDLAQRAASTGQGNIRVLFVIGSLMKHKLQARGCVALYIPNIGKLLREVAHQRPAKERGASVAGHGARVDRAG